MGIFGHKKTSSERLKEYFDSLPIYDYPPIRKRKKPSSVEWEYEIKCQNCRKYSWIRESDVPECPRCNHPVIRKTGKRR